MHTPDEIVQTLTRLESERSHLNADWDMIGRLVVPGRGKIFEVEADYEESTRRTFPEKFDSTATVAAQSLAAALHSGLTSPSLQWFHLKFEQEELNKDITAKAWLEECGNEVNNALQESNFNLEVNELYLDEVTFGTTVMFHEEQQGKFRFATTSAREIYFTEDFEGNAAEIYRPRQYSARQIADKFENAPAHIKERAENPAGQEDKYTVIQCAILKDGKKPVDPLAGPQSEMPYEMRYILKAGAVELTDKKEGYYELPAYVVRWGRMAGSKYGYSPALNVLPDIKSLNSLVEVILAAAAKVVDPPIMTLKRGVLSDPDLTPGGETVVNSMDAMQPFETNARFDVSELQRAHLIETIRKAFYVDQLDLPMNDRMTATEVQIRYEQMQARLGPILFRIQTDFLAPLIKRSFGMLYRGGNLPPAPDVVLNNNAQLDIDYLGPLARSQKLHDVSAIERTLMLVNNIAGINPEVLDAIKWPELVKHSAQAIGVPAQLLRSRAELRQLKDQREAAQNAAQQAELAQAAAAALKDSGSAAKSMADAGTMM